MKQNSNDIFSSELKSEKSAVQKIEQLFKKHFRSFSEMPSLASVVFSEEMFRNEKVLIEKISELIEQNNKILLTILNEGQNNNELRNDIEAAHLAVIIMGALRLFVKKWQISGFTFDLQVEGNKLIQSVKLIISK